MGNKKIWEPTLFLGSAAIFFSVVVYLSFIYNKDSKDGLEEIGETFTAAMRNTTKPISRAVTDITSAMSMRGGSATKRHKKQSKGKGKSHKKH